mgnify:CR=1 FL=1
MMHQEDMVEKVEHRVQAVMGMVIKYMDQMVRLEWVAMVQYMLLAVVEADITVVHLVVVTEEEEGVGSCLSRNKGKL